MTLDGYQRVFERCERNAAQTDALESYRTFRDNRDVFHFLTPVRGQRQVPDFQALGIAVFTDPPLCAQYMAREKSLLGYASPADYHPCDVVDSRHIMMSTLIFSTLGRRADHVVEIGGGWGNWVRLNETVVDYRTWTIIDLPFVTGLQRWFLSQELTSPDKVELVDTDAYPAWRERCGEFDLLIGAHSLSELPWDLFVDYLEHVATKARHFFYATHLRLPDPDLVQKKLRAIEERFDRQRSVLSENGTVDNILFRRRD